MNNILQTPNHATPEGLNTNSLRQTPNHATPEGLNMNNLRQTPNHATPEGLNTNSLRKPRIMQPRRGWTWITYAKKGSTLPFLFHSDFCSNLKS